MKFFHYAKDGGQDSTVWGWWLIEWKRYFSIALLCFEDGSREAFHSHAFNSISWVLRGCLEEHVMVSPSKGFVKWYRASIKPVFTPRNRMHKVTSRGRTWVLTFRGPWADTWWEYLPDEERFQKLTHGRRVVE